MSQWTLVKSRMNDLACIKTALDELGCDYEEYETPKIMQGDNRRSQIDLLLKRGRKLSCNIGFSKTKTGEYELVMSAYADNTINDFIKTIKKTYLTQKILKQMQDMECIIASKEVNAEGQVCIMGMVG